MSQPDSNREDKPPVKEWGNCKKCGWYYKQSKLDICPMCRHPWRQPVGYNQPKYEPPTLE
jgi:predicted Zn-ribbon and HTH transcriptional regulator